MADPPARPPFAEISLSPLFWTRRASLTVRILVVNIVALALLAGSLFYLDSYRKQLLDERYKLARSEAQIMAEALYSVSLERRPSLILQLGKEQRLRIRFYDRKGKLVGDSFELARKAGEEPAFTLIDPATEPWYQEFARTLDRGMDTLLGAPPLPPYVEPSETDASAWPELIQAKTTRLTQVVQRYAPDRTPVITAAAPVGQRGALLLTTRNAHDITERVRGARQTLAIIIGVTLLISIQLSLFLARTIVQPLRMLVRAAVRVRLGRDREVEVPRLPERRDEIGMLARAISDMTAALRQRMDAVESFAADVAHEIKNPLASLRSALESLSQVEDPSLRRQLAGIAVHDLQRIDRLVTEIADASRIDAELSRATFEPVDLALLVANLIGAREERQENEGRAIRLLQSGWDSPIVMGVPVRLERVIENLLDNAVSFSPKSGTITVEIATEAAWVRAVVCDEGPGIPRSERENIFARFHSVRPEAESFGNHSGLGLAIARTIAEAHDGTLRADDRADGKPGACLILELPRADVA
jgi:two-component system sensor histidine kinase ChvG